MIIVARRETYPPPEEYGIEIGTEFDSDFETDNMDSNTEDEQQNELEDNDSDDNNLGDTQPENNTEIENSDDIINDIVSEDLNIDEYFITNAVRCYPEKNMPKTSEINNCQVYNFEELSRLKNLRVIVALGEVAYKQIIKLYDIKLSTHKFKHGNEIKLNKKIHLISSYHCSKLNMNTHKINKSMLKRIFLRAIELSNYG